MASTTTINPSSPDSIESIGARWYDGTLFTPETHEESTGTAGAAAGSGGRAAPAAAPAAAPVAAPTCCAFCTAGRKTQCLARKRVSSIAKLRRKRIKSYDTTEDGRRIEVAHVKGALCSAGMDILYAQLQELGLTEDAAYSEATKFFIIVEDITEGYSNVPEEERGTNPDLCACIKCTLLEQCEQREERAARYAEQEADFRARW